MRSYENGSGEESRVNCKISFFCPCDITEEEGARPKTRPFLSGKDSYPLAGSFLCLTLVTSRHSQRSQTSCNHAKKPRHRGDSKNYSVRTQSVCHTIHFHLRFDFFLIRFPLLNHFVKVRRLVAAAFHSETTNAERVKIVFE